MEYDRTPHSDKYDTISDWKDNPYYSIAEAEEHLAGFWGEGPFRWLWGHLDPTDIVELACGHGRHVPQYQERAKSIILVDPNKENIDFCANRFSQATYANKITYYVNNGADLSKIQSESRSSIFCYDAMVHFEIDAIISYLHESFRILKRGCSALFHHSNAHFAPGFQYGEKPHSRNFMSAEMFAHFACRAGFVVPMQILLPWHPYNTLDCVSLLLKN